MLRLGVRLQERIEEAATDERGRHAVAGPAPWVVEQLNDYLEAGCDGFVVNLDHHTPGMEERIAAFAADVRPLLIAPPPRR
jgi:alkanesulfonate monooxygenase SsuD/methylene tetrahydromethanopterin reductase-like flavin-dependent oxidoreductase (luciferase family)